MDKRFIAVVPNLLLLNLPSKKMIIKENYPKNSDLLPALCCEILKYSRLIRASLFFQICLQYKKPYFVKYRFKNLNITKDRLLFKKGIIYRSRIFGRGEKC